MYEIDCLPRAAVVIEPVSDDSLRKTGIFPDTAGDFRRFLSQFRQTGSLETVGGVEIRVRSPASSNLATPIHPPHLDSPHRWHVSKSFAERRLDAEPYS